MKKVLVLVAALALVSTSALALISNSAHDLSTFNTTATDELCIYCHVPHNATALGGSPLWNRADNSATVYTNYTGVDMNGTSAPGTMSLVCLSCHDGTVALDAFGGSTGTTAISGSANLGTDLSNDHPVGVAVTGSTDIEIQAPTDTNVKLFGGNAECASCHDVHNGTAFQPFLAMDNAGSALCLQCHAK